MKVFTLRIEVTASDTSDDVAAKLECIAKHMRSQSAYDTFLEDASYGAGALNQLDIRGTWSVDP